MKIQTCTGEFIEGATAKQLVTQLQKIQFGGIDEADLDDYMNRFLERMCLKPGKPFTVGNSLLFINCLLILQLLR